jgi:dTMP kinase
VFLTFEGIEGCGKSTQARRLAQAWGPEVLLTREPGATALGQAIRGLLLDPGHGEVAPATEALLYFADRAQHVEHVLRPALAAGRTVISDRYVDSSLAYQGYGRGLDLALLEAVARLATGGLRPDLTVLLEVPVELGLERIRARGSHDRLESERREFHERVSAGYDALAGREPERWLRVDGRGTQDEVAAQVRSALEARGARASARPA